jgi:hypothetical protein
MLKTTHSNLTALSLGILIYLNITAMLASKNHSPLEKSRV